MKYTIIVGIVILVMGIVGIIKSRKDIKAIVWIILGIIIAISGIMQS